MFKGQRVTWTTAGGVRGSGVVVIPESEGHVAVAVDAPAGEEHRMIWCAVTWLALEAT